MSKIINYITAGLVIIVLIIGAYTYNRPPEIKEVKAQEPTLEERKKIIDEEKKQAEKDEKEAKIKQDMANLKNKLIESEEALNGLKVQS